MPAILACVVRSLHHVSRVGSVNEQLFGQRLPGFLQAAECASVTAMFWRIVSNFHKPGQSSCTTGGLPLHAEGSGQYPLTGWLQESGQPRVQL